MKREVVFLISFLSLISFISATSIPIYVTPLTLNGTINPNTTYAYYFNLTTDSTCNNVVFGSPNFIVTTGSNGIAFIDLTVPDNLTVIPSYLCEYRNGTFVDDIPFSGQFFDNVYAQNINTSQNIYTAGTFYGNGSGLSNTNASTLNGYNASFFMPLNNSLFGNFSFNGGWQNGGLSILGGNIYTQTLYTANFSNLNVSNININGSFLPYSGFDNQFNLGGETQRWDNLFIGGNLYSNGTIYENSVPISTEYYSISNPSNYYNSTTIPSYYPLTNPYGYYNSTNLPPPGNNLFDQVLNTTSNVTFFNVTATNIIGGNICYTNGTGCPASSGISWTTATNGTLAQYQFTNNNFNGSGDVNTSGQVNGSTVYSGGLNLTTAYLYNSTGLIADWNASGLIANTTVTDWLNVMNGTLALMSNLSSYYLASNPLSFFNSTTLQNVSQLLNDNGYYNSSTIPNYLLISNWNSTNSSYITWQNALNGTLLQVNNSAMDFNISTGYFNLSNQTQSGLFYVNGANGRVGIGTTAPSYTLDLNGDENINATLESGLTNVTAGAGSQAYTILRVPGTTNHPSTRITVYPSTSPNTAGNILSIGNNLYTASTGGTVTENASDSGTMLELGRDGSAYFAQMNSSGNLFYPFVISAVGTSAGNVGIGTATPQTAEQINFATGNTVLGTNSLGLVLNRTDSININYGAGIGLIGYNNSGTTISGGLFGFHINYYNASVGSSTTPFVINESTGNGNVGINTTTPQNTLNVQGDANFTGSAYSQGYNLTNGYLFATNGTYTSWANAMNGTLLQVNNSAMDLNISSGYFNISNQSNSGLFYVNGANGRVGIGTTTPQNALNVIGSGNFSGGIDIPGTSTKIYMESSTNPTFLELNSTAASGLTFSINPFRTGVSNIGFEIRDVTAGVARISIDGSGNVGIGVGSPTEKLDVNGTINASQILINGTALITWAAATNGTLLQVNNSAMDFNISTGYFNLSNQTQSGLFYVNGANGRVGIGTTSPAGLLSVASSNAPSPTNLPSWSSAWAVFGPNAGSANGAALGLGYNNSNGAYIYSVAPDNVWEPLTIAASNISFLTGATNLQGLFQSGTGNVGINTTNPQNALNVVGSINISGNQNFTLDRNGVGASTLQVSTGTVAGHTGLNIQNTRTDSGSGIISFKANSTATSSQMVLLDSGNVGINTTTPQNALNVLGDINATTSIYSDGYNLSAFVTNGTFTTYNFANNNFNGTGYFNTSGYINTSGLINGSTVYSQGYNLTTAYLYNSTGLITNYTTIINGSGLIQNWNVSGWIANWNATGYIANWNATGLIANWTNVINATGLVANWTNIVNGSGLIYNYSKVDNGSGLIQNWNVSGWIANWNATGYIANWNATGLIANWTNVINATGLVANWTNIVNGSGLIYNYSKVDNGSGLIQNWNVSGWIANWNATGYIANWNATGLIANWTWNKIDNGSVVLNGTSRNYYVGSSNNFTVNSCY